MSHSPFTPKLQALMQKVGISSFQALSQITGVSKKQILRLRRGEIAKMRVQVLTKLATGLQISLPQLVAEFSQEVETQKSAPENHDLLQQIADLKVEYQHIQLQLLQQRELLQQEFQQSTIQQLESLLLQFPTAAYKARENPQLPAVNILPLIQKPLEQLLRQWGIEAIATVGAELSYDPQQHQLMAGTAQPGELVKVRYIGYRQGEKLLYRAKVSK
ncbi:helix-turn-helix domain-containing protein [Calothrix sp. 336/3]|uniref:helix-turn-helix domain-containing protein n=1 Tax=Calothrix sp. 336/3 TaxID=1337936 RepID=UPI0004E3AE20|nr:helix-turn-helix domain-containing protein [Calothrix sp. 336/3]AKG23856.1 XRE family transcriptional regulator [Calothrix sp. 336/3]